MRSLVAITFSMAFVFTAGSAEALQRGQGQGPKVKPPTTTSAPKMQGPKSMAPKPSGNAGRTQGPKATTGGSAKVHTQGQKTKTATSGPSKKTTTGASAKKGTTSSATATTSTTSSAASGSTVTLSPVQQKLQRNTKLASKLEGRLPAGTRLMDAADGFRNLGQFVAAVNVSNNLGIPFADLKTAMVKDGMSLGQAIKSERPKADATFEARRAETDANRLIQSTDGTSSSQTQTAVTTPTKSKKSKA